jgi:site-specific recombinase XerD
MTHLRKIMLEELQRRHYSEATTRYYIRAVERFAQYFHCSPDRLGTRHIREYQAQLFTVQKLSPGTVTDHLCALRFFYIQLLKRPWSITDTPYPKKTHRLPTILSHDLGRHSLASFLMDEQANPAVVQAIMRHSQMDMTLYYAHSSKKQKRAALDNYAQHIVPAQRLRVPLRVPASA